MYSTSPAEQSFSEFDQETSSVLYTLYKQVINIIYTYVNKLYSKNLRKYDTMLNISNRPGVAPKRLWLGS